MKFFPNIFRNLKLFHCLFSGFLKTRKQLFIRYSLSFLSKVFRQNILIDFRSRFQSYFAFIFHDLIQDFLVNNRLSLIEKHNNAVQEIHAHSRGKINAIEEFSLRQRVDFFLDIANFILVIRRQVVC